MNDVCTRHEEYAEQLENTLRQVVAATLQEGPLVYPLLPEEFPVVAEEVP